MLQKGPSKDDGALRLEIETLRARFAKMSEVGRRITEIWDLDVVLQEIVDGARTLTDAKYGAVGVFDNSGQIGEFITSGIAPEHCRLLGSLPKGLGLFGYLNEIQEPLRLADLTQHSRSVGFPENHSPMKWGRRRGRDRGSENEAFPLSLFVERIKGASNPVSRKLLSHELTLAPPLY